jgi:hypothetical protein
MLAPSLDSALSAPNPQSTGNAFATLQHWYAQQFAWLLARLRGTPVAGGTLFDQIWNITSFGDPAIVRQPLTEIFRWSRRIDLRGDRLLRGGGG